MSEAERNVSNNDEDDDDDDTPQLSANTFAALQEFYNEQEEREKRLELIKNKDVSIDTVQFDEDWQLSQFWYDDHTTETLAKVASKIIERNGKIALISCPTLYPSVKKLASNAEVSLFEYDQRFAIYGSDFVLYDYKSPLDIPRDLADAYDLVIADPPFLSDECLTKTAVTIKFLCKKNIILCTGIVMSELAERLLNLKKCEFEPKHKNNLGNTFGCFSNFNVDTLI